PLLQHWESQKEGVHRDFPAASLAPDGSSWIVYVEHDGTSDTLWLTRLVENQWAAPIAVASQPGIIHQPSLSITPQGDVWVFWGQVDDRDLVSLRARGLVSGKWGEEQVLSLSDGSETFADAATDAAGRVWVVWQSFRRGQSDIFTRWLNPSTGNWSEILPVSVPEGGSWEPRLAFGAEEGAWISYDNSKSREFNLWLAHVALDGQVKRYPIAQTPHYEARSRIAAARDGKGFWITAERGRKQWGEPLRGHESQDGINAQKQILFGFFDAASKQFTEHPIPAAGRFAPRPPQAINLPTLSVDTEGNPWMAWRYYALTHWRLAVSRFDRHAKTWSAPMEVPDSAFSQDRHSFLLPSPKGMLLCWASDKRTSKRVESAGIHLARLSPERSPYRDSALKLLPNLEPPPYLLPPSAPRPRDEHHVWTVGGKTYRLLWGDLHRHTDFSNCRTPFDGCVLEHFRYGYDIAALDFMGTSDHTDIAKRLDPYEWWQTQKLVDVFYTKGHFRSLYAYEREQKHPWGHRNVVFAQRGGPVVYLNRLLYSTSPWGKRFPVNSNASGEITPQELWSVLLQYGKPVATISHTGATGMGTDWDRYPEWEPRIENTVEIFQGARVSYEGLAAPQPTAGLRVGQKYTADAASEAVIPFPPASIDDFGSIRNRGLYQYALSRGLKLGVFASSDHIAQHTSFGGVYVEEDSRTGILSAFQARNSIAATAKIFVEFSCNDRPMGQIFESKDAPKLALRVLGTGPLKQVTVVRNEQNLRTFSPKDKEFALVFHDDSATSGENRYYLRVEQEDGNMAWSSPIWVSKTP
ncbi:MAG: hypothetical protein RLZZ142_682, partial [Verrucomicrobiota bacterium]